MGLTGSVGGLSVGRLKQTASAYATLIRVPNLFTAPPDILAGAALAVGFGANASWLALSGLVIASMLFYAGGTSLNDYFDASADANHRPNRPIPAGEVARSHALIIGIATLGLGVGLAVVTAGLTASFIAAGLVAMILLYDGYLKGEVAGFLAMGTIRGLNVLLGTTATDVVLTDLSLWIVLTLLVVTGYIAGVTYMAAQEAIGGDRTPILVAGVGTVIAGTYLLVLAVTSELTIGVVGLLVAMLTAGIFLVVTGRSLWRAYQDPVPETIGPTVGVCILALVIFDTSLIAMVKIRWALLTVGFLVLAVGLSRFYDIS